MRFSLDGYDYAYPRNCVALAPARPRDAARLLIYDRAQDTVIHDRFRNLAAHLPDGAVVVMNETKVIPARFVLTRVTGGRIRALYLSHDRTGVHVLVDRSVREGERLAISPRRMCTVRGRDGSIVTLIPQFPVSQFLALLARIGTTPLPPYLRASPLSETMRRREYQSILARRPGSVAAPTASLHFTSRLLRDLRAQHIPVKTITLHVGLGTFAPISSEQLAAGTLHAEHYLITRATADFLNRAKASGRPIIAVGTTVVRALESAARPHPTPLLPGEGGDDPKEGNDVRTPFPRSDMRSEPRAREESRGRDTARGSCMRMSDDGGLPPRGDDACQSERSPERGGTRVGTTHSLAHISGTTTLFIRPGYRFQFVDGLITNFHVPRSSLMMLVATMTGREKLLALYREAIVHDYRLFSFGDAMFIR